MASLQTQDKRLFRIETTLGSGVLVADNMECQFSMSRGFTFKVNVFSEQNHSLKPEDIVGTSATIELIKSDDSKRYFNGLVSELSAKGTSNAGERSLYQLTITSWLELLLAHRSDCRIFQDEPVDKVINTIFADYGDNAKFKVDLANSHSNKRFWVQYNETDLEFFKRICQQSGLTFYFTHKNGQHTLNITDDANSLPAMSPAKVRVQSHTPSVDHLTYWQNSGRFVTGKYSETSYNYMTPQQKVEVKSNAAGSMAGATGVMDLESYVYSDTIETKGDGKLRVSARRDNETNRSSIFHGGGDCRGLDLGHHFSVELAPVGGIIGAFEQKDEEFTLTRMVISADNNRGLFNCRVEAVPRGTLIFPDAAAPKIQGLQTAVVTGPKGEEIHTDEYGRIKVQFHWDRLGKSDQESTCWLRVMQGFAGSEFGAYFLPRVGQEVVVAFENGNPERPFALGSLYHTEHKPPYSAQMGTRSGIRTRSMKGGGVDNCNELYFEDKKGEEEVYFQAEKDHNGLVKNDQTFTIQHDQTLTIQNDQKIDITNKHTETVGADSSLDIGGNQSVSVGGDGKQKFGGNLQLEAGGSITIKAGSSITLQVGGSKITIDGGQVAIKAGAIMLN
ncbi:type VI secretion system Vgr family protein [Oceanobacter kriegii]|uniref:type VI secretion system Vgr family protein n=1 Tax=Oceanobacter kriegii TaxID=64972 RepID=UPI0004239AA2|nr:type VI secretion system tip protein TssI/VgrG [Oceanobacter kriegii]